jgi:hypothetical protein
VCLFHYLSPNCTDRGCRLFDTKCVEWFEER